MPRPPANASSMTVAWLLSSGVESPPPGPKRRRTRHPGPRVRGGQPVGTGVRSAGSEATTANRFGRVLQEHFVRRRGVERGTGWSTWPGALNDHVGWWTLPPWDTRSEASELATGRHDRPGGGRSLPLRVHLARPPPKGTPIDTCLKLEPAHRLAAGRPTEARVIRSAVPLHRRGQLGAARGHQAAPAGRIHEGLARRVN
jgi:hypothetical protein